MPRPKKKKISKIDFSGSFYSDSTAEDMEYAVILRSPQIGGKIQSITIPDLPEDYYIITGKDVPGSNQIDTLNSHIPLFYEKSITYIGAPIGILVGKGGARNAGSIWLDRARGGDLPQDAWEQCADGEKEKGILAAVS